MMRTASNKAKDVVSRINRRQLTNTQKVLLSLIKANTSDGWVARTALRVPNVGSRVRDLRKEKFGGFVVECTTAADLHRTSPKRCVNSVVTSQQTFYRIVPKTVTVTALKQILKGVV